MIPEKCLQCSYYDIERDNCTVGWTPPDCGRGPEEGVYDIWHDGDYRNPGVAYWGPCGPWKNGSYAGVDLHCWAGDRPEFSGDDTCLLPAGHRGEHLMTPDGDIEVEFK